MSVYNWYYEKTILMVLLRKRVSKMVVGGCQSPKYLFNFVLVRVCVVLAVSSCWFQKGCGVGSIF